MRNNKESYVKESDFQPVHSKSNSFLIQVFS